MAKLWAGYMLLLKNSCPAYVSKQASFRIGELEPMFIKVYIVISGAYFLKSIALRQKPMLDKFIAHLQVRYA